MGMVAGEGVGVMLSSSSSSDESSSLVTVGLLEINSKYQRREYDTKIRTRRATWNLVAPAGTRDGQTSSSAKIITDS